MTTGDDVLDAVERVRIREGACSLRALAAELGISHTGARYWVLKLCDAGILEHNGNAGSIRRVGADDHALPAMLVGTITLGISYGPGAKHPLLIQVIGTTGAATDAVELVAEQLTFDGRAERIDLSRRGARRAGAHGRSDPAMNAVGRD